MPFSPRYIVDQMSRRGRMPQGEPEPELHQAIANLNAVAIDQAVSKGARMDVPDYRGRTSFHALADQAIHPDGQKANLTVHPERILACVRALLKNRANPLAVDPRTGLSALSRLAPLVATSIGPALVSLMRPLGNWNAPTGPGGTSVREHWAQYAEGTLKERLLPTATQRPPIHPAPARRSGMSAG